MYVETYGMLAICSTYKLLLMFAVSLNHLMCVYKYALPGFWFVTYIASDNYIQYDESQCRACMYRVQLVGYTYLTFANSET